MIGILPQVKELQRADIVDLHGDGTTILNSGSYRNITGVFADVGQNETIVYCLNFNATVNIGIATVENYISGAVSGTLKHFNLNTFEMKKGNNGGNGGNGGGGGQQGGGRGGNGGRGGPTPDFLSTDAGESGANGSSGTSGNGRIGGTGGGRGGYGGAGSSGNFVRPSNPRASGGARQTSAENGNAGNNGYVAVTGRVPVGGSGGAYGGNSGGRGGDGSNGEATRGFQTIFDWGDGGVVFTGLPFPFGPYTYVLYDGSAGGGGAGGHGGQGKNGQDGGFGTNGTIGGRPSKTLLVYPLNRANSSITGQIEIPTVPANPPPLPVSSSFSGRGGAGGQGGSGSSGNKPRVHFVAQRSQLDNITLNIPTETEGQDGAGDTGASGIGGHGGGTWGQDHGEEGTNGRKGVGGARGIRLIPTSPNIVTAPDKGIVGYRRVRFETFDFVYFSPNFIRFPNTEKDLISGGLFSTTTPSPFSIRERTDSSATFIENGLEYRFTYAVGESSNWQLRVYSGNITNQNEYNSNSYWLNITDDAILWRLNSQSVFSGVLNHPSVPVGLQFNLSTLNSTYGIVNPDTGNLFTARRLDWIPSEEFTFVSNTQYAQLQQDVINGTKRNLIGIPSYA